MKFIPGTTSKGWHYSSGVISCGTLFILRQLPIDLKTEKLAGVSIAEQTRTALRNEARNLHTAGAPKEDIVRYRVYISEISLWVETNAAYSVFFGAHKPVRVMVPTMTLHHGALVEIEAIAEMEEQTWISIARNAGNTKRCPP